MELSKKNNVTEKMQKFGKFLSGMVMPNIGAFIAWGLITAFFIATGWTPNERLSSLVDPMIKYLLPLIIGYTGGKMVAETRGGVIGAVATMGVIVGADIAMFIGAMIMGPFAGWVIKKFDKFIEGKVPTGFEMLVNNFSIGILGMLLAVLGFLAIGPVVTAVTGLLSSGVEVIISKGLLPLVSIFIEPAKVLFLNNAINHGILGPIGIEQVSESGKSIMFLLESNPGPGLGVLLAYCMFSKGMSKQSAPGAAIIHFLGGIHEIYFPYILMNPILIVAVIAGGAVGVLVFSILGVGLVATPSPGSIFAILAMTQGADMIGVILGVLAATAVSFLVAAPFVKKAAKNGDQDLESAKAQMKNMKAINVDKTKVSKIVFACDAGMGSSAMGASKFRNRIKDLNLGITVVNSSVDTIPGDADIVVTHITLIERAQKCAPNAEHITIENFLNDENLDSLYETLSDRNETTSREIKETIIEEVQVEVNESEVFSLKNIALGLESVTKEEAIEMAGKMLVEAGYVNEDYIEAMQERERVVSTYIGMGVAIPHGVGEAKEKIKKSGIVALQFPQGVDFGDELAYLVFGIAGAGNEHIEILGNIASALEDPTVVDRLKATENKEEILKAFS